MKLSIVVACSTNDVIGINNQLPWYLPADLKFFKNTTNGHTIIMGRKTFESIGKPLPNRENIVISRAKNFEANGIIVKHSIEDAIDYCKQKEEVFVIGGANIYAQILNKIDRIYLTRVHTIIENGDAFFSIKDTENWKLVSSETHTKDEKNIYDYTFEIYEKE